MYLYKVEYSALVIMQSKYWLILKNIQDALCPKIFSEGFLCISEKIKITLLFKVSCKFPCIYNKW